MKSTAPPTRSEPLPSEDGEPSVRPTVSVVPPPMTRTRSWTLAVLGVLAALAVFGFVLRMIVGSEPGSLPVAHGAAALGAAEEPAVEAAPAPTELASQPQPIATQAPDAPRADAKLRKTGRGHINRGVFLLPPAFASADGSYDLIVHFHGNTDFVEEGLHLSGVNAAVLIFNYGIGSNAYEGRFADPKRFGDLMANVDAELADRGLVGPKRRRVALTAWSAGYGAIMGILAQPKLADQVDAIILLDGMHANYIGEGPQILPNSIQPFLDFAARAKTGEKLFVLTHSNVDTVGYVPVAASAQLMLDTVKVERKDVGGTTTVPGYKTLRGIVPRDEEVTLVPKTVAHEGGLWVKSYRGNQPGHHMAHLVQFPSIAMPLLIERWSKP